VRNACSEWELLRQQKIAHAQYLHEQVMHLKNVTSAYFHSLDNCWQKISGVLYESPSIFIFQKKLSTVRNVGFMLDKVALRQASLRILFPHVKYQSTTHIHSLSKLKLHSSYLEHDSTMLGMGTNSIRYRVTCL
jgi:hypothetical protein